MTEEKSVKFGVTITKCDKKCKSEFQDKTYGQGMRVFNNKSDGKPGKCTVCGNKKL